MSRLADARQDRHRGFGTSGRGSSETPLSVYDLTVAYHRKPVIWDVEFDIPPGSLVGIVGPNGSGKTTLLKTVMELIPRASGRISVFGKPYHENRHRVGYMPQRESVDWDFPTTVLDVVMMGRYPSLGFLRRFGDADRAAVVAGAGGAANRRSPMGKSCALASGRARAKAASSTSAPRSPT